MEETKDLTVWDNGYYRTMQTLRKYVTQMQSVQACNGMNQPLALVSPVEILATGFLTPIDKLIDSPPDGAILKVSYLEGLPTINGVPIWERLEGEPPEYYKLFKRYRDMRDAKVYRAVYKLAQETNMETRQLELLRQVYHWNVRVSAYDEYLAKERAVVLELRRQEIEGKHAQTAEQLFKISSQYLTEHPELLTPKIAMQMLDMAVRLERFSVGLHSDKRSGESTATINIQNNVQTNADQSVSEQSGITTGNKEDDTQRLTQLLNVMNKIGVLAPETTVVDVAESEAVD